MSNIMARSVTVLGLASCVVISVGAGPGDWREPERWACEIDLHQGDAGRLEFQRTESGIDGVLTVQRQSTGAPQTSSIKGSWSREVIRFTRTQPATSEQSFIGIAVGANDRIKVAGRYAAGFEGIWSATCSRDGAGGVVAGADRAPDAGARPPAPPAKVTTTGSCVITVVATGPRANLATAYQTILRGPDSRINVKGRQPFGSGRVTFSNLADGQYLLTLDTKADVAVTITPRNHEVTCRGTSVERVFEFR